MKINEKTNYIIIWWRTCLCPFIDICIALLSHCLVCSLIQPNKCTFLIKLELTCAVIATRYISIRRNTILLPQLIKHLFIWVCICLCLCSLSSFYFTIVHECRNYVLPVLQQTAEHIKPSLGLSKNWIHRTCSYTLWLSFSFMTVQIGLSKCARNV